MKTPDNLKTENWYYMQVFTNLKGPSNITGSKTTICFAPNKDVASSLVNAWLTRLGADPAQCKIHWYLKNYKREAAKMVAEGNYIA
jgi:hypothetical protein